MRAGPCIGPEVLLQRIEMGLVVDDSTSRPSHGVAATLRPHLRRLLLDIRGRRASFHRRRRRRIFLRGEPPVLEVQHA